MKALVLAIALCAAPLSAWAGCGGDHRQAMSCAEGLNWDPETGTCVPAVTG
jgi:hypothetical protein